MTRLTEIIIVLTLVSILIGATVGIYSDLKIGVDIIETYKIY